MSLCAPPLPGLSTAEARQRLATSGPNEVPPPRRRTWLDRIRIQLVDPMIVLLCGAFVVVCWLGDVSDAVIIAAVVVLNTTLGVVQEQRAERAIAALEEMATPRAFARRDGALVELPARELVAGDEVRLEAGDVVPADVCLSTATALAVDESAMTGESVPVARSAGEEALAGTVVTHGSGFGTVVRTGARSGLGRIATLVATTGVVRTPLQRRLARLSRQLTVVVVALAAVVMALAIGRGQPVGPSVVLALSLAVAAIPESLPAVVSVALALGASRMARRGALVRWLPAVETLGSVSVLASDKTGTLTEGRMTVRQLWTPDGSVALPATERSQAVTRLLRDLVLCNDAHLAGSVSERSIIGDPMEGALLLAAASYDDSLLDVAAAWPRTGGEPFDNVRRTMSTEHAPLAGGGAVRVTKGAPEVVLALAPPSATRTAALAVAEELARGGSRVLGVVEEAAGHAPEVVGLVALVDPPRADAADLVGMFRDAGIRTLLVTGDHPATAHSVAAQVGIAPEDVFARVRPEQKVEIVESWQGRGHVVAMTGDGVNDAPALRRSDIGVAMGRRGTEVARQAADVVLAGDDLRSLITAVGEGRRINQNIRTFLRFGLSGGMAEVLVLLVGPFLGLAAPLLPGQILWINMLTHGVPGVAFGAEPLDPDRLHRPPASPERSVLGGGLVPRILLGGTLIGAASLASGLLAQRSGWPVSTCVFLTLGFAQLITALALRTPRRPGAGRSALMPRALEVAVAVSAALQVLAVTVAPLRDLLATAPLPPAAWLACIALAVVPAFAVPLLGSGGRRSTR